MPRALRASCWLALALGLAASTGGCCCWQDEQVWRVVVRGHPCCPNSCACTATACPEQPEVCELADCRVGRAARQGRLGHGAGKAENGGGGLFFPGPGHFFPVPTRPVFGPTSEEVAVPTSSPGDGSAEAMPDPNGGPAAGKRLSPGAGNLTSRRPVH
jgi:hypothetical protein